MLASGNIPDIITIGSWETGVSKVIDEKLVYPLNELATKYDPYWFKVADEGRLNWYRREDGNVYGYPNSSFSKEDYEKHDNIYSNQTFLVRKDIYEAIGSPDMTTPEGFKDAVQKAYEKFPYVDGKPLIPIGAHEFTEEGCNSFDKYLMNFLAIPFEKDGQAYDRFTDPEYITWLKTFRSLGAKGYLANDIFLDKRVQMEEQVSQGRYFCMLFQRTDIAEQQKILYKKNPDSIYIAVDGPRNSKGSNHTLPGAGISGWTLTMISKKCSYPDRAIQLMTYFMSEHGQKIIYLGIEGKTYDMINDKPVIKPEVLSLLNSDRVSYDNLYGADNTYWMLQDNVMQLNWEIPIPAPLKQLALWTRPYVVYTAQYDYVFSPNTDVANANKKINNAWGEVLVQLLVAESEEKFDKLFNDFLIKREKYGYEMVRKNCSEQIIKSKKLLGISP